MYLSPNPPLFALCRFLLIAQVVLALQLPFTLIPLIKATSSASLMGAFKNTHIMSAAAWGASLLVFVANLMLFVSQLMPGASYIPDVKPEGKEQLHLHTVSLTNINHHTCN